MSRSRTSILHWSLIIVLLLAGALRFWRLDTIPPGWRDDELIELDIDARIAAGWRPLYIEEAEGHEPLYHYVHAVTIVLFGTSRTSYRWLSAACGLLTVALTITLSRRLFGMPVALWAGAAMAVGFWPLMYSRFGVRHVGVLPPTLLAFYALWRGLESRTTRHVSRLTHRASRFAWFALAGIALAAALYTYFAGRVVPLIVAVFALYLLLFHRSTFRATWRGWLWAGMLTLVLFAPLGWYLAHRPLETRLEVVGRPLFELLRGDPGLALQTTLGTLGMFTTTGDPEWLYNIANRPVFNLLGGVLVWVGMALCLYRWRQPRYFFLALWFGLGLAPAFVSIPAASLGHTILAQPAAYVLIVLPLVKALHRLNTRQSPISNLHSPSHLLLFIRHLSFAICHLPLLILLATNGFRDLRDYFVVWPRCGMVRFLYHADVADLGRALRSRPDVREIAVATITEGLRLDAAGLAIDLAGTGVRPRLFDPTFALVFPAGDSVHVALTTYPPPHPLVASLMEDWPLVAKSPAYRLYQVAGALPEWGSGTPVDIGDGLTLVDWRVIPQDAQAGQAIEIATLWRVRASDDLLPTLKFFFHLIAPDGRLVATGDRLSVWPPSLRPGDVFIQITTLTVPADISRGDYVIQTGVYDEATGQRWNGSIRLEIVRISEGANQRGESARGRIGEAIEITSGGLLAERPSTWAHLSAQADNWL